MNKAFVIMQIGNPDLDNIYKEVFAPVLKACDLDPKRVDKHNEGRLLKSEIVKFIEEADIIIADLTNERPNCYLEIGYAMGLDKFRNLILTAREDHFHDSPNYKADGPKIHFDLSGYDILFWNSGDLDKFRLEIEKRIRRRLSTLPSYSSTTGKTSPFDEEWVNENRGIALSGLQKTGKSGFMEIIMALPNTHLNISQAELLHAADAAQIHTFGWPLAVVLNNRPELRPKPKTNGIAAEIYRSDKSYDYWTIRKDGSFYLLKSLFEDTQNSKHIFFNTRIVRITEALLYSVRLYSGFKIQPDARIVIGIKHKGLKNRVLDAIGARRLTIHRTSIEDEIYSEIDTTIEEIESKIVDLVDSLTAPLFVLFDYYKVDRTVLDDIVNKFVDGNVT